nr:MAG TPA: hypothetical protein [Caudoviricetes sp.]
MNFHYIYPHHYLLSFYNLLLEGLFLKGFLGI